jgi:hypothetical protein
LKAALDGCEGHAIIAEVKLASPSKGDLGLDLDPVELAHRRYREILEANPLREPDEDRGRQIVRVVRDARRALGSITGALE